MSKNVAAILRAHELARKQRKVKQPAPVRQLNAEERDDEDLERQSVVIRMLNAQEHVPDPLGIHKEPKSLYSAAPTPRTKFEKPKKRRTGERNERDCELPPDPRRHQVLHVTDESGRNRATIEVNPFAKRLTITGPGFR
jgi:hypothetical protein